MRNNCSDFVGCHAFVFGRSKAVLCYKGKNAGLRWSVKGDFNPVHTAFSGGNRSDFIGGYVPDFTALKHRHKGVWKESLL